MTICSCPLCNWMIGGASAKESLRRFDEHVKEQHDVEQVSYLEDEKVDDQ